MKWAIFSDIHGNLEALEAVMRDMEITKPDKLYCMGDIVGYGTNSPECLEAVRALGCPVLRGNHDEEAALDRPVDNYSLPARAGMLLARKQLSHEQKAWLSALPYTLELPGVTLVHASLHDPTEFIYILDALLATSHFEWQSKAYCFHGHTHVPVIWRHEDNELAQGLAARGVIELEANRHYNINVGSVGQPRDFDPRASYVIFEPEEYRLEYRRIEYPIEVTQRKILLAGLPTATAARLAVGR
ncbi:MAG TPA: metallophosphoesterase family protein [Candidatus Methylacidiphilales bacterium]|nr:metallophosphoesterase family protein [Candidatus Methylacidiphilales bacterium]